MLIVHPVRLIPSRNGVSAMSENFKELAGLALASAAFWSVFIGIAAHSLSWLAFAAVCAALSVIVWSE